MEGGRTIAQTKKAHDLVPSLSAVVEAEGLDSQRMLGVALPEGGQPAVSADKHQIPISDGEKVGLWAAPPLAEMFRGDKQPPSNMNRYPPEYVPHFYFVEQQVLLLCQVQGDRTDQELADLYAELRRRPDGRSLGKAHDFLWQVAALLLGTRALSQAEFEAIFSTLHHSAKTWSIRPVSRNYVAFLRKNLR
jgi:hypothetical protein